MIYGRGQRGGTGLGGEGLLLPQGTPALSLRRTPPSPKLLGGCGGAEGEDSVPELPGGLPGR